MQTTLPPPTAPPNVSPRFSPDKLLAKFSRTFFCIGPLCLRSGVGPGAGVGCGVGLIRGPMIPLGGESGNLDFLRQLPGGYQIMNVLRTVMRKFPGSKTGVGCGVGVGVGFGIGIAPAGGGRMGGMGGMMGGMGGGMMGGMGGTGGGGGMGGFGGTSGGMGGMNQPNSVGGIVGGEQGAAMTKKLEERLEKLEDRFASLEERLNVATKVRDLEERLYNMEKSGRRRR